MSIRKNVGTVEDDTIKNLIKLICCRRAFLLALKYKHKNTKRQNQKHFYGVCPFFIWLGCLIFPGCLIDLIQGEYGPIFAYQLFADTTATTHTEPALHSIFQGHDDVVVGISQLFQNRKGEFDHDRRPADNSIGVVVTLGGFLLGDRGGEADIVFPPVGRSVDGQMHVDVIPFFSGANKEEGSKP